MMSDQREFVDLWNTIYDEDGFIGVMNRVSQELERGKITVNHGLFHLTTGGWRDDELIINSLTSVFCRMNKHYCGYIRGGSYFFNPYEVYQKPDMVIMSRLVDDIIDLIDNKIEKLNNKECNCGNCAGEEVLRELKMDVRGFE